MLQSLVRQLERICVVVSNWLDQFRVSVAFPGCLRPGPRAIASTKSGETGKGKRTQLPAWRQQIQPALILLVVVLSLSSVLGHRFYNQPQLDTGKAAPQTIYAPADARVEDSKATEEKRKLARSGSLSILMLNRKLNQDILQRLQQALDQGSQIRKIAGSFPFTATTSLSVPSQRYLRRAQEWEWRLVLEASTEKPAPNGNGGKPNAGGGVSLGDRTQQMVATELQNYRRNTTQQEFASLQEAINDVRRQYGAALTALPEPGKADSLFDASLFDLVDGDWQKLQSELPKVANRMLTQGIAPGLPQSLLEEAIKLQVQVGIPEAAQPLASKILLTYLRANLDKDEEQTRLKAEQAAQEVSPEYVTATRGTAIVEAGDLITSGQFALLDHFGLSRRGVNWWGMAGFTSLVAMGVIGFWFAQRHFHPNFRRRDYLLLWLLSLSVPLLLILRLPGTSLPAVGMLVGSFYGSALGFIVPGLLALILPYGTAVSASSFVASAAAGLLSGFMAGRLRTREELAWLGVGVGLTQGVVYLLCNAASGTVWYTLLGVAALRGLLGLTWCVVAIGVSPYLENLFDLVTTIRLVELANPNRPLLKKLAAQTPGTFQHTLFVATLAEAAARVLGCNVELVRAGTLHHDIGKMHDPLGFIENQMGGVNKHDLINDPWKSAEIIKKHVTEGLVMARKHRLPKAVQAFIPEHQGTMLIAYFHHQAQQRVQQNPELSLQDQDFRYDGPIPQSRETGIVMLADSCEAALRSLKDATPEDALAMINKILRARWQDNQLLDSGLTREEMGKIARIFVQTWQESNHQRIAYPKVSPPPPAAPGSAQLNIKTPG